MYLVTFSQDGSDFTDTYDTLSEAEGAAADLAADGTAVRHQARERHNKGRQG